MQVNDWAHEGCFPTFLSPTVHQAAGQIYKLSKEDIFSYSENIKCIHHIIPPNNHREEDN